VVTIVDSPRYVKMPVLPYFLSPSFSLLLLRPNEPHIRLNDYVPCKTSGEC
jgi:hypothetical protein